MMTYAHFSDLAELMTEVPPESIVSRTLYDDDRVKAVLFGFAAGQQLSEHTASQPAILHFVRGQASLTLADDTREAREGTWVHMPARLPHSVEAESEVIMLLLLLKS
jgi:quercetin dioxygenase-like cupin family protein